MKHLNYSFFVCCEIFRKWLQNRFGESNEGLVNIQNANISYYEIHRTMNGLEKGGLLQFAVHLLL